MMLDCGLFSCTADRLREHTAPSNKHIHIFNALRQCECQISWYRPSTITAIPLVVYKPQQTDKAPGGSSLWVGVCTVGVSFYEGDTGESYSVELYEQECVEIDLQQSVCFYSYCMCVQVISWLY